LLVGIENIKNIVKQVCNEKEDSLELALNSLLDHLNIQSVNLFEANTNKNNLVIFKEYFRKVKYADENKLESQDKEKKLEILKEKIKEKPLCIYAISNKYDDNGAILSNLGLGSAKSSIRYLSDYYTVIPISFGSKNQLNEKINKYKKLLNADLSLLVMNGHGSHHYFSDFYKDNLNKLSSLSSETQIVIDACETGGGEVIESIAYKIAKDNQCEVFAAKESITKIKFCIEKNIDNKPKVKSLAYYACDIKRLTTVRIDARPKSLILKERQNNSSSALAH
jgi:hypothetical protein